MSQWFFILLFPAIFISVGAVLPYIQDDLLLGDASPDISDVRTSVTETATNFDEGGDIGDVVTVGDVLVSVIKMFFWTFGELPLPLELFFLLLRIVWFLLLVELFWI